MSYEKELVFALRLRNVDEHEIADIVDEVKTHERDGVDPHEFFGPPTEYAARFPQGPRTGRGSRWTKVGAAIAIGWIVVVLALVAVTDFEAPIRLGSFVLWPALAAMVLGIVADFTAARNAPVKR